MWRLFSEYMPKLITITTCTRLSISELGRKISKVIIVIATIKRTVRKNLSADVFSSDTLTLGINSLSA